MCCRAQARQKGRQQQGPVRARKQPALRSRAELQAEALAAVLARRGAKKGKQGRTIATPLHSVRGPAGPDALQALRAKIGRDA